MTDFVHPDPAVKGMFLRQHSSTGACGPVQRVCHLAQAEQQCNIQALFMQQDFSLKGRNLSVSS